VVHITDAIVGTRAQQMVSHTAVRITETVFAHAQHWEEQNILTALLGMLGLYALRTHFFLFTTQKQFWWDANTETMHQQLLQLVSITQ